MKKSVEMLPAGWSIPVSIEFDADGESGKIDLWGPDDSTCWSYTLFPRGATGEKPLIISHSVVDGGGAAAVSLDEMFEEIKRWGEMLHLQPLENPELKPLWDLLKEANK